MEHNLVLLEYKPSKGHWHLNTVDANMVAHNTPGTYGWESVALTTMEKAMAFTNMLDCKLQYEKEPYPIETIRKEWKLFCFTFNYIIKHINVDETMKKVIGERFDSARSLARLGHKSFSDLVQNEGLLPASEYNPLDFIESNF